MKSFFKILIISSFLASSFSFAQSSGETFFSTDPTFDSGASRLGIDRNNFSLDKQYSFENCSILIRTDFPIDEFQPLKLDQTPGKKTFFENVNMIPKIWPFRSVAGCESPFVISHLEISGP